MYETLFTFYKITQDKYGIDMKKLLIIIVVVLFLIEIVVGSFLFYNIQIIQTPKIKATLTVVKITPDETLIQTHLNITNSNPFDLVISNLVVNSTTQNGDNVLHVHLDGGVIPSNQKKVFTSNDTISFHGNLSDVLSSSIQAVIGFRILGFLEKTIPLDITVDVVVGDILNSFAAPQVHIESMVHEISTDGISFQGTVAVDNPNTFDISVENLSLLFENKTGTRIGSLTMMGGVISGIHTSVFPVSGKVGFEVLNPEELSIKIQGDAGIRVSGLKKIIPFFADISLSIPQLSDLLTSKNPINISLIGNLKLTMRGLRADIEFNIYNPYVIAIAAQDLVCLLSKVDRNKTVVIGETALTSCVTSTSSTSCLDGQIIVPYFKLLFTKGQHLIPQYYKLTLQGNFSFQGINQSLPLSINAFLDVHFLR